MKMPEYIWYLYGKYNNKWEELFECENEEDAMQQLACYDENEPNYLHKIVKLKIKINNL